MRSPLRRSLLLSLLGLLLPLIAAVGSADAEVRVLIAGGHEDIRSYSQEDIEYISMSELVEILGGSLDWKIVGHEVVLEQPGYRFIFLVDAPFVKLNDTVYNITYPVQLDKGQLFVPAETFLPFLDRVNDRKITWDRSARTIRVDSEYFNVTDVETMI